MATAPRSVVVDWLATSVLSPRGPSFNMQSDIKGHRRRLPAEHGRLTARDERGKAKHQA